MGIAVTKYSDISTNELVARFCSNEIICPNDPFWNQLLAFNIQIPSNVEEQLMLDSSAESLLQKFLQNNQQTGNLGSLVQVFITRATELLAAPNSDNVMLAWQSYNALFVIRAVTKYLVELVPEYELCKHLDVQGRTLNSPTPQEQSPSSSPTQEASSPDLQATKAVNGESRVEMLIDALIGLIIDVPITDNTYYLHLECLNTLLVLMSVYMFAGAHGQTQLVETSLIYRTLFQGRYSMHAPLLVKTLLTNLSVMLPAPPQFGAQGPGSLLINIAYTSSTTPHRDTNGSVTQVTPPRIDLAALHRALCATAGCEHSTLLLYLMLHSCKAYKRQVSNGPNIENLLVPILQVLYNAPDSTSHHIYMSLIVLLILTEDDSLIKNVHLIMLKNIPWYTERSISEISLGGLAVLVVVRALQYNMARVRDKYLHTNCLAAIANMSCEFRNLHPYVAQRLVSLFETLTKRRARLCTEIEGGDINSIELPHHAEEKTEEIMEHIAVLDEVLRMLLEIINSCLTHQLSNNLNLVYALLHKRQLFQQHAHHHIAQNIEMVIGYFSTRLQRVQEGAGSDLGVTEVLQCIKKGAEQWSSDRLKKFPDLKFRYVEEDRPEEFFTPYVWALVAACGGVYWASERADLLA
nr:dymeclin isoform X2 [Vanessa tameamea]